jgi:hypothetical protein
MAWFGTDKNQTLHFRRTGQRESLLIRRIQCSEKKCRKIGDLKIPHCLSYGNQALFFPNGKIRNHDRELESLDIFRNIIIKPLTECGALDTATSNTIVVDKVSWFDVAKVNGQAIMAIQAIVKINPSKTGQWSSRISATPQYDLELDGVRLTDPAPRLWAIATRYQSEARKHCAGLRLIKASKPTKFEERHNFLVFFSRSIQGLCDGTVDWQPTTATKQELKLFKIFADHPKNHGELFWNLHSYLENPTNGSFGRRMNIFFSIYSMYLALSYQNRYVGLAVNEFLPRHDRQMRSVEEFDLLRPIISAQLLAGVLQ